MPLLLELFSGTGSIGKAFAKLGWVVFSIDNNPTMNPSLVKDVMNVTPEDIPGTPDFIWGSPPCTQYSMARTHARLPRDLEGSDALVRKTLDHIRFYRGVPYMIENPHTGLLKTREVIQGIPLLVIDYCKYGAPYRKRTAIWTETAWIPQRPLCRYDCAATCMSATTNRKRHAETAQQGNRKGSTVRHTVDQLHAIPEALCDEIAEFVNNSIVLVLD